MTKNSWGNSVREINHKGQLAPRGETTYAVIPLPPGARILNTKIELDGKCGCGAKMERIGQTMTFRCSKDRWWRFWNRKHVRLEVTIEELPESGGNA